MNGGGLQAATKETFGGRIERQAGAERRGFAGQTFKNEFLPGRSVPAEGRHTPPQKTLRIRQKRGGNPRWVVTHFKLRVPKPETFFMPCANLN